VSFSRKEPVRETGLQKKTLGQNQAPTRTKGGKTDGFNINPGTLNGTSADLSERTDGTCS
jgi:hypothetical protein